MQKKQKIRETFYLFRPLILYMIVLFAVSAVMEAAGGYLADRLADPDAGPARIYSLRALWTCLLEVLPPAAGCLCVRGTLVAEVCAFCRKYPRSGPLSDRLLFVLMAGTMSLAAAVNVLFGLAGAESVGPRTGLLPGPWGFVAEAVLYGLCIPLIEESIFRGILLSRLERSLGLMPAVFFSAALFGAYHGSLVQGAYAMLMGIVFALAYARTGRPLVPVGLHGACNLLILVLARTGAFPAVCSLPWAAALFAIAAAAFYTVLHPQA